MVKPPVAPRVAISGALPKELPAIAARFAACGFQPVLPDPAGPGADPQRPLFANVVSVSHCDLRDAVVLVRRMLAELPDAPLVLHVDPASAPTALRALRYTAEHALDALILTSADDPFMLERLMFAARTRFIADRVLGTVSLSASVRIAVPWIVVGECSRELSAESLAVLAGHPYRTLVRTLEHLGLPEPKRCIQWGQLVMAADLLERQQLDVNTVAARIGFAGPRPLKSAANLLLAYSLEQLAEAGAFERVCTRFHEVFPPPS